MTKQSVVQLLFDGYTNSMCEIDSLDYWTVEDLLELIRIAESELQSRGDERDEG
jgi:hypothetical protein